MFLHARTYVICAALFLACAFTHAATLELSTNSSGPDQAGNLFSAALQMELDKSGLFTYTQNKKEARFYLEIQTMGMNDLSTIVSIYKVLVLLIDEDGSRYYINSWVGYAGRDKAPDMGSVVGKNVSAEIGAIIKSYEDDKKNKPPTKAPL